jgi:hypothetical protein
MCAALLVLAPTSAQATQATGEDVAAWGSNWSWTYGTTFTYDSSDADASIEETVTYANPVVTTFAGQPAYRLTISGNVSGGSGKASGQNLTITGGSVSGTRFVRQSDLSLLQEQQTQHVKGKAGPGGFVGVTADVNLTLTPSPGWRTHDFPLNSGDSWHVNETVAYTGGFSYDAGSIGGSGSSDFDGSFPFNATSTVSNESIPAAGGTVATKRINAQSNTPDGLAVDQLWWSQAYRNDAKEHMVVPLDDATLTIDRVLSSASTPAPSTGVTATLNPSLTCAGGDVDVTGKVGGSAGVPVSIRLDRSQIGAAPVTATATTTAGGSYSATLTAPSQSDGLGKNGSRANWGVVVSGGGGTDAATLVVSPLDCTTLEYTGVTSATRDSEIAVSAKLTDLAGASVNGRQVTFSLSGGGTATATANSSGIATAVLSTGSTVRNATMTVHVAGTSTMAAASDTASFAVTKVGTSTSVSASLPSVEQGEHVTFTADVASAQSGAGTPTGTVQFKVDGSDFGAPVTLAGGSATSAEYSTTAQGDHTVQAVYGGDGGFDASTSSVTAFEVTAPRAPTTTTLSASPGSSVFGEPVHLSASVAPNASGATPTGSVAFKRGGTLLGTAPLDGSGDATLDTAALPVGTSAVVATYSGDETYKSSSSAPQTVVVDKADVAVQLQSSAGTTVTGEAVDFTASVGAVAPGAGTPTGTIQLLVDGNPVGDPVAMAAGAATFAPVALPHVGSHTVEARYSGDTNFATGSDATTQVVNQAGTAISVMTSPSVSNEGAPFTVIAAVAAQSPGSGTPAGNVTFYADGDVIGAASLESSGEASIPVSDLQPGDHVITATYGGSADFGGSTSEGVTHSVIEGAAVVPTAMHLATSENPTTYGRLISFTAAVTAEDGSTPTGTVHFSVDGTDIGSAPLDGDGVATSTSLAAPEPGDHMVIASLQPDAGYAGSGDFLLQTVTDASVHVSLDSSDDHSDYGQGVHFTAQVTSAQVGTAKPTGSVQFWVDGAHLGDAVALQADGTAVSPTVSDLQPGDHAVRAQYSGDAHFLSDRTTLTQQVAKVGTTTALTVTPASSTYGDQVELAATVTPVNGALGAPAGSVDFVDGTTVLGTVPLTTSGSTGVAHLQVSDLGAGAHSVTAVYSGSPTFASSTSPAKALTVGKRATSISAEPAVVRLIPLGLPLGQLQVTVSSSLGPVAGVPVTFKVAGHVVGTATTDVNGAARVNASSQLLLLVLSGGYTATFDGDANYVGSTAKGGILG